MEACLSLRGVHARPRWMMVPSSMHHAREHQTSPRYSMTPAPSLAGVANGVPCFCGHGACVSTGARHRLGRESVDFSCAYGRGRLHGLGGGDGCALRLFLCRRGRCADDDVGVCDGLDGGLDAVLPFLPFRAPAVRRQEIFQSRLGHPWRRIRLDHGLATAWEYLDARMFAPEAELGAPSTWADG